MPSPLEAVKRAVASLIAETANGTGAPSRLVTEISDEELAGQLAVSSFARAAAGEAPPVTESEAVSLPDEPLHELDFERFEDLAAAALAQGGEAFGSPFWAGANAVRSPFWRGLDV